MTYIEFFDEVASRNISTCLTYAPDRVIYIGADLELMEEHKKRYERIFRDRGRTIEFITKKVSCNNLEGAVNLLSSIVNTYDDCVFDVTGGAETLNVALGIVYERYPEKDIRIQKINIGNGFVCDCDKDGETVFRDTPQLSVDENIRIYGGEVPYGDIDADKKTYKWDLTPEFLRDFKLIWQKCKESGRFWNVQIGVLEAVEAVGSRTGLTTTASRAAVERYLAKNRSEYVKSRNVMGFLTRNRLITRFSDEDGNNITVTYKNEQIKRCLTVAGQALEMQVFLAAKNARDKKGNPAYNDVLSGVHIDWDGVFHDAKKDKKHDTVNEIDVLLMHGIVPVFISCKNGNVKADELYKLCAVADRFGGPYAKKVLVASALQELGVAGEQIRDRAKDMGIQVVENVWGMSDAQLSKKLRTLWMDQSL